MVGNEMEMIKSSKKLATSHTFSGTFPSPESPSGSEDGRAMGHPKGWYSERVPQSGYKTRKSYAATAALLPFSSGRALPSKWDDAERWISSPVSVGNVSNYGNSNNYFYGTGVHKGSHLGYKAQRRAKSKSGPLGPAGSGLYGNYNNTFSPVLGMGVINGGKWRNSLADESSAEVGGQLEGLDIIDCHSGGSSSGGGVDKGRRRSCPGHDDPEWMNMWTDPFCHSDKHANDDTGTANDNDNDNDNNNAVGKEEAIVDRVVSRRDMATQMYPESETSSLYSANSPSSLLLNNEPGMNSIQSPEFEVRDVQIDRQTSRTTQRRSSPQMNEPNDNFSYSTTTVNEDDKMFKLQREEARINAWENLQKANAESAIQKLEMKLEKKRTASMQKIIERLRRAEIKAQKMRGSLVDNTNAHVESGSLFKTSSKIPSFCRKIRLNSSSKTSSTCFPF